jgi:hypothetical protein
VHSSICCMHMLKVLAKAFLPASLFVAYQLFLLLL